MATGQVSFHNQKLVKKVLVQERENAIVNRLNKTRDEKFPDLKAEKEEYLAKKRKDERKTRDQQMAREKQEKRERQQLKWQKDHAYDDLMTEENLEASSNQDRDPDFLDDFMWCPPRRLRSALLLQEITIVYGCQQYGAGRVWQFILDLVDEVSQIQAVKCW